MHHPRLCDAPLGQIALDQIAVGQIRRPKRRRASRTLDQDALRFALYQIAHLADLRLWPNGIRPKRNRTNRTLGQNEPSQIAGRQPGS
jgi:hypothetical protein